MSAPLRILGLDIAAVHSGAGVVEARVRGDGSIEFEVLAEHVLTTTRVASNQPPTWESMVAVAKTAWELCDRYDVTYVAYEGFAKGWGGSKGKSKNTTAYEHAELVGVVKTYLYKRGGLLFVQVPPTTLTSFYGLEKGNKKATQEMLADFIGWESKQRLVKERSDCADAVAHAIIGGYVFAILGGWDPGEDLDHSKRRILFGDERRSSPIVGLLRRPHLYIPRDACIPEEDT